MVPLMMLSHDMIPMPVSMGHMTKKVIWCRFLILLVESCSKLVISVTEHLVEVVDKLSTTTVVFFRSERILKCKCLYGA